MTRVGLLSQMFVPVLWTGSQSSSESHALAAGNCVVLKPAEQTPASILYLMQFIEDLLPPGVLNIVNGIGEEAGAALSSSKRIAKIAFTGSTPVGKMIMKAAAETAKAGAKSEKVIALDLSPAELDEAMQAYFAKCKEKLGFIPSVLQAYSFDLAKLKAFVAMSDDLMLAKSGLSKIEREMIAVVVSSANHCHYCLVAHGAVLRKLTGDPMLAETMVANYRAAELDARTRAMLDFSWRLTETPWEVGEEDRAALRKAGFSERDIWDISAVAAFFNMSNRLATATGNEPNPEYYSMAR